MNSSRCGMRTLAAVALAHLLTWSTPILAEGVLLITVHGHSESAPSDTGRTKITTWAAAQYSGALGADYNCYASLGTGVKEGNDDWSHNNLGTTINARLTSPSQEMVCSPFYGGTIWIDVCKTGTYIPTQYDRKTEVAIVRSSSPNFAHKVESWGHRSNHCDPPGPPFVPDPGSPIILDLDRNGFHLTGIEDWVIFDIDADGVAEMLSWTRSAEMDGFLALDRNGNGVIDDGGELFGNHTLLLSGDEAPHGYIALAEFDKQTAGGNEDGSVDERDAIFAELRVWIDFNHDGYSQELEIVALADKGVTRLELWYVENRRVDRFGNQFRYNSRAWVEGPGARDLPAKTSDVFFVVFE